jgi:hypothetical protein
MTTSHISTIPVISVVLASIALCISLWNVIYAHLWPIRVDIVRENEIRFANLGNVGALNVTFVIFGRGPISRHTVIKFDTGSILDDRGLAHTIKPSSFLQEEAHTQKNISRNLPISIKGGSDSVVTVGYEPTPRDFAWRSGHFHVTLQAIELRSGRKLGITPVDFTLTADNITVINSGTLMLPVDSPVAKQRAP